MPDLDELQRLAEGATPGPWEAYTDCPGECCWLIRQPEQDEAFTEGVTWPETGKEDAAYIAAMSPDTAKKLIAVARAAEKAVATLEEAQTYTASPSWSPSMTQECKDVEAALRTALEDLK
jgi:hypothetical protein